MKVASIHKMKPFIKTLREVADIRGSKYVAHMWGHSRQYIDQLLDDEPDLENKKNFPLEYAIDLMDDTGDITLLHYLAARYGCRLDRVNVTPDQPTSMHEAAQDIKKMGERNQAMLNKKHPNIVENLNNAIIEDSKETCMVYRDEWETGLN